MMMVLPMPSTTVAPEVISPGEVPMAPGGIPRGGCGTKVEARLDRSVGIKGKWSERIRRLVLPGKLISPFRP